MISPGMNTLAALAVCMGALAGCSEQVEAPEPLKLTREAIGHYCNMIVADHPGPKAQIHEKGRPKPLWFSSVRDGLAYMTLPGEAQRVVAFYVHDMSRADNWETPPDDGIWIKASEAVYVIGSTKRGGMGAREAVPFKSLGEAQPFAAKYGGKAVSYAEIPKAYILGDDNDHTPGSVQIDGHKKHGG